MHAFLRDAPINPWQGDPFDAWLESHVELAALRSCHQDARHHGEGDVATHTRMVLEELRRPTGPFWDLDADRRCVTYVAAVLHDVGKPACSVRESDGSIRTIGHARHGEQLARRLLWEAETPPERREAVCRLVRRHMTLYHVMDAVDPRARMVALSALVDMGSLVVLADADARGRISPTRDALVDAVALAREQAVELDVLTRPWPFGSEHARLLWHRGAGTFPPHDAWDDTEAAFRVTLLSGLPGVGKDTWIATHGEGLPVVSLDRIRQELGVKATGPQGRVVQQAREQARVHLRKRSPFIWNATNVTRDHRRRCVDLFLSYGSRVRIVHVETTPSRLRRRNRERAAPVPSAVLERLIRRWEPPDPTEAHEVVWVQT